MDSPQQFDPTALAKMGPLEVVARLVVEGYLIGRHRSPFKGTSVEFVEHRMYTAGDEIRHIDWRAYAKSGEYYVKQFEEETNLRAYLIVDVSGSMGYGQSTLSKLHYARILAASLAYLLHLQRDACGLAVVADRVLERREPLTHPHAFQALTECLTRLEPRAEGPLHQALRDLLPTLKRRSLVFLLTDAFDDLSQLTAALRLFPTARHDLTLLQIVTPEEDEFPFRKPVRFRNLEQADEQRPVDPPRERQGYLKRYREFCEKLQHECQAAGIDYVKTITSQPFAQVLGECLFRRAQRAK